MSGRSISNVGEAVGRSFLDGDLLGCIFGFTHVLPTHLGICLLLVCLRDGAFQGWTGEGIWWRRHQEEEQDESEGWVGSAPGLRGVRSPSGKPLCGHP